MATTSIVDDPRLMPWREWDALVDASANGSVFQHSLWLRPWCATFLDRQRLHVVLVRDGERLLGGFPFVRARVKGVRVLRVMGGGLPAADHLDVVALPGHEATVGDAVQQALRSAKVADIADLDGLAGDSSLTGLGGDVTTTECPRVELPGSWDDYLQSRTSKFRGNYRRYRRMLHDTHGARLTMPSTDGEIDAALRWLAQQRVARCPLGAVDSFADERMVRFHSAVARGLAHAGHLRWYELVVGEQRVASVYCVRWRERVLFYNSAIDEEWSKSSPGTVVLGEAIEKSIDEGARIFDMLRGDEAYKRLWSTSSGEDVRVVAPMNNRGRIALAAKGRVRGRGDGGSAP